MRKRKQKVKSGDFQKVIWINLNPTPTVLLRETYEETGIRVDKKELKSYSKIGNMIYFFVYKPRNISFKILDKKEIDQT